MASVSLTCVVFLPLICIPYLITAQQPYAADICQKNNSEPSVLGYRCNGQNSTCQAYLLYRAQPPYNTISSIASLLSANASQISSFNKNVSENMSLATNTDVVVPVTCSCSGRYYQANTTHVAKPGDTYFSLANDTFKGLTTCNAIQAQRSNPNANNIALNERLTIPLRCACPTRKQLNVGLRYILSFVVQEGNDIASTAIFFGGDYGQTLEANEKSEQNITIEPFTTLLVPLPHPPNVSRLHYHGYVPISPSSPPSLPPTGTPSLKSSISSERKWVYFGVGLVAGSAFASVAGFTLFFMFPKMSEKKKNNAIVSSQSFEAQEAIAKEPPETETESMEFLDNISNIASMKVYSFKDLLAATENFSAKYWIKGSVYKGSLKNNQVVIKKMDGEVSNEINVLNKISHFNLVKLLGVCLEDGVWYFIYEYASNGPLSDWIYQDSPDGKTLSWGKRMQVACDVATGLRYLHAYTSPPYVHKDVTSNNVLLNSEFRAKIAKFGLSRPLRGLDGQFTLTEHIVGTKGYLAPEYLENGIVSPMLDVYAFGVLLLEIVTGKDVASLYEGVKVHLSEVLTPVLRKEDDGVSQRKLIDSSLGEDYPADIAHSMLMLIDRCLKKDPGSRPSMDEIVQILSRTLTTSLIWGSSTSGSMSTSSS